jgi:hypothetical protein
MMGSRGILVVIGATVAMVLGFGALAPISVFMRPPEPSSDGPARR